MIPRSLGQSTRHFLLSASRDACGVCTCSCGRAIPRNVCKTPPARAYASRLRPPPPNTHARAGPPKQQMTPQGLSQDDTARLYRVCVRRKLDGSLQGQPDQLLAFVQRFADVAASKAPKSSPGVDVSAFKEIIEDIGIASSDARWCARWLLSTTERELRQLGRKIMYTLSHVGDGWATLIIMEGTLAETANRTALLKSPELLLVRRQLTEMAAGQVPDAMEQPEQLFMAKVCQGRVAACLGSVDDAISMWMSAMDDAVAYAKQRGDKAGDIPAMRANSSPWIDIFNASLARGKIETARWAVETGCQLDDPVCHYHAALLERKGERPNQNVATSTWLYHIIKAAGSGHVKAIHALGVYYSTAAWKYFKDEPPDHIKPTPFDSYPSPKREERSYSQRLSALFGLQPASIMDPKDNIFMTAVFPSEPQERWKMAMSWLDTAMGMMYVPSFLLAAKLLMQDTLSPKAVAPEEALQLNDQRYEYASKADCEVGRKIRSPEVSSSGLPETAPIPNPGFDLIRAKDLIREVFYAVQAQAYRHSRLSQHDNPRPQEAITTRSSSDMNMMLSEEMLDPNLSPNIRKWFRFPELMVNYTEGKQGILYDDLTNVDVALEARRICDESGWDLYDEDGGLVYKHR